MKKEEKLEARRLRIEMGLSFDEISKRLGVSRGSVVNWVKDVKLSACQIQRLGGTKVNVDVDKLKTLVEEGRTQREISKIMSVGYGSIRRAIRENGIETRRQNREKKSWNKFCVFCGNVIRGNYRNRRRCQSCSTKIRRIRTKWAAVQYLGGKCKRCGWVGCKEEMAAYEFHHPNKDKDFNIGNVSNKSWSYIKKELDKCVLECSRCHRILHSDRDVNILNEAFSNYNGSLLSFE